MGRSGRRALQRPHNFLGLRNGCLTEFYCSEARYPPAIALARRDKDIVADIDQLASARTLYFSSP